MVFWKSIIFCLCKPPDFIGLTKPPFPHFQVPLVLVFWDQTSGLKLIFMKTHSFICFCLSSLHLCSSQEMPWTYNNEVCWLKKTGNSRWGKCLEINFSMYKILSLICSKQCPLLCLINRCYRLLCALLVILWCSIYFGMLHLPSEFYLHGNYPTEIYFYLVSFLWYLGSMFLRALPTLFHF